MNIIVLFVVTIFDNKRRSHHIISAELPLRWSGVKCKTIMDVSSQLVVCWCCTRQWSVRRVSVLSKKWNIPGGRGVVCGVRGGNVIVIPALWSWHQARTYRHHTWGYKVWQLGQHFSCFESQYCWYCKIMMKELACNLVTFSCEFLFKISFVQPRYELYFSRAK